MPSSVCRQLPSADQIRTVQSLDADATVLPSGENATELTESVCLSSVCRQLPSADQIRTVPSFDADATVLPSGETLPT
ncbi:hypothetical protein RRF57_010696 [Xylaria bambusicola]|uniref:Uncharacterized protein n=1 Tax=Xylaria bambusicola TaxID=326684 RepID=A0AAN7V3V6_9PEZI